MELMNEEPQSYLTFNIHYRLNVCETEHAPLAYYKENESLIWVFLSHFPPVHMIKFLCI